MPAKASTIARQAAEPATFELLEASPQFCFLSRYLGQADESQDSGQRV